MRCLQFVAALAMAGAPALTAQRVLAVNIDGVIHPITVEIVGRALHQAADERAELVLLRLNTPGGLLDASRQVMQAMAASPVPIAVYVTPGGARAASAGFFLLEAADFAAMAPGTNAGASSPVLMGQQMDPVMRAKVENDASALLRSITARRGRNSELAEKTIREAKAFTEQEALNSHLIDAVVSSEQQLLQTLDGRELVRFDGRRQVVHTAKAQVSNFHLTTRESIVSAIASPNIGFILLLLGALGLYVEFSSPGLIVPGIVGAILALLGLSSLSVLPINWAGAALLVLALSLFVLEAKFMSHGILATGGAVSMVLGAMLLINGPPEMRISFTTALAVTIPFALITVFLLSLALRARRNKVLTGSQGMLNEIGIARTDLAPEGKIFIHGEYWDAVADTPIRPGDRVRVTGIEGLKLHVVPEN